MTKNDTSKTNIATENLYYFEDFSLGEQQQGQSYTATKSDAIRFAETWDPQPWHIDEAAAKQSMFGGLTLCSSQIFSICNLSSQNWQSGFTVKAVASLGFSELQMHKPVFVGDTLDCISIVETLRPSKSRPECGIVISRCQLINQHQEMVFSMTVSYLVARKTKSDEPNA